VGSGGVGEEKKLNKVLAASFRCVSGARGEVMMKWKGEYVSLYFGVLQYTMKHA